jgi:hypothetical protein
VGVEGPSSNYVRGQCGAAEPLMKNLRVDIVRVNSPPTPIFIISDDE